MQPPASNFYSKAHLWTRALADGTWEAGITEYAQDLLGDIVFIDAPPVGSKLTAGVPCGLIESVKTGSDLHALVDGDVTEVNETVINTPELINEKPYEAWIFKYKPSSINVVTNLLSAEAYQTMIENAF